MTDTLTATIEQPRPRFTLAEMSVVMMNREKPPIGFFVSQALWDSLSNRVRKETGLGLGTAPIDMHGVKIVIDPDMPDNEFDVAFTDDAWRKRVSAISNG